MAIIGLHNSDGYHRVTTVRDVVWVKLIENVDGFLSKDIYQNRVRVGAGACYAIINERKVWNEFSKEPLVIPADKMVVNLQGAETPTPTPRPVIAGKSRGQRRSGFSWSGKRR